MKNKKCNLLILMILFCLTVTVSSLIAWQVRNSVSGNIFVLSFKEDNLSFSQNDIDFLTRKGRYFSFVAKADLEVSSAMVRDTMKVIGTNENLAPINRIPIKYGSFFNGIHEKKLSKAAVLSNAASWHLFGCIDCVGNYININNEQYEIIGVLENNSLSKDEELIYIPFGLLETYQNREPFIYEVHMNADSMAEIESLIKMLGYAQEDVRVFAMEQYKSIMVQRVRIIIFLSGLFVIIHFLKGIMRDIKICRQDIAAFLGEHYVKDVMMFIKEEYTLFVLLISKMLAVCTICKGITFKVCVPYNMFSLKDFNLDILVDILMFFVQPYGTISTVPYLDGLNLISNLLFFASALLVLKIFFTK